jgi:hypothetical protein
MAAGTPQILQGVLNRLVASVSFTDNPALNVTPPYLGRRAIRFTPDGDVTMFIGTMTGMVTSPEPYVGVTFAMALIKPQPLAAAWQAFWLQTSLLGDAVVRPDVSPSQGGIGPFQVSNCGILRIGDMGFDGEDPIMLVTCRGTYYTNNVLWNG